jgi:hypothetical protein
MKKSFASGKCILKKCIQTAMKKKNTKTIYLPKFEKEILYCKSIETTKKRSILFQSADQREMGRAWLRPVLDQV